MLIKLVYAILIVKQDSGIFAEFRASIVSFGHPDFFKCGSFGHPRVEIRASLAEILPPRLATFRRLHNKFYGPDKDTYKMIKPCKYHPLETCNSDETAMWMCLPWEAAAMLGCPKLEFQAPVGALWWWRHQMETFSALLAICAGNPPVTGEFPALRPVTRGFDVFFDLHPNKRLSKQWWGRWFGTPSLSL